MDAAPAPPPLLATPPEPIAPAGTAVGRGARRLLLYGVFFIFGMVLGFVLLEVGIRPTSSLPLYATLLLLLIVLWFATLAHELGHVQQYQTGSALIKARGFLLPAVQFSPTLSYLSILAGIIFNVTGLLWLGVFFFGLMVLFSILTLPVEFDASRRGIALLGEAGLLSADQDRRGANAVLRAAALTYIAAAVTAVLQLLYYITIANRRR